MKKNSITSEMYELSLVFPRSSARSNGSDFNGYKPTKPMIVFSTSTRVLAELDRYLGNLSWRSHSHAREYCPSGSTFWPLAPDLFGHIEFGYGRCGFVTKKGDRAFLHIELERGEQLYCCAMTLKLLAQAFETLDVREPERRLRPPQVTLSMACENIHQHGHTVNGYVSAQLMAWLKTHAKSASAQERKKVSTAVVQAMKRVWKAVCLKDDLDDDTEFESQFESECRMAIDQSGRFFLGCAGNACDLSIYPDRFHEVSGEPVPFGSHNLDRASQQITLVSGLVKLCQIARQNAPQKK